MSQEVGPQDRHLHEVIGDETEEGTRSWESFPLLRDGEEGVDRRVRSEGD